MTRNNFEFQIAQLTLKGQYYEPKDIYAVVVLVHGMGEYSRRYERTVVPLLLKSSIAVISYDQFGHGHSQEKKGDHPGYNYLLDSIDHLITKAAILFPSKPVIRLPLPAANIRDAVFRSFPKFVPIKYL